MNRVSKATKIKAIQMLETLKKNGLKISDARAVVANEFDTKVYTVTQWEKKHGPKTTVNRTNNVVVSPKTTIRRGFNGVMNTLADTLDGIIDGSISPEEARSVSTVANSYTNMKRLQFNAHKHVSRATNQQISVDKLLGE